MAFRCCGLSPNRQAVERGEACPACAASRQFWLRQAREPEKQPDGSIHPGKLLKLDVPWGQRPGRLT